MNPSEQPEPNDQPSAGPDNKTVRALGALSKALETTERARGRLYDFHQLTGTADLQLDDAVQLLDDAGHPHWAQKVRSEILGRNVIPDHWTFQIVEAYNDTYYQPFRELEADVRRELAGSRNHLYEARLKEERRTHGHPDHTAGPSPTQG
ncbi:hypothetical protein [Streptomyces sp. 142MFCol3.1]|uniref:hypothetical protein n=1 Tax=Streptomyces sp. 142MFCol3.1 TaxID=1172179 RepID=UPI0003F9A3EE|nr:hypothetical protein [Streptomyces sp. 142MFCol3.1]